MEALFLTIINMSITATYILAFVLLMRLPLRRAPRWLSYALWLPVLFRLVCPVSFSSSFAALGRLISPPASQGSIQYIPPDIGLQAQPQVDLGVPGINRIINQSLPAEIVPASVNPLQIMVGIGAWLWLTGFLVMLTYSVISYLRLKRRIRTATWVSRQIYESDEISSPFVCGFLKPAIYLPVGLGGRDKDYVLRHERAHLERFDHLVKPLAFMLLSIHWFNPLMWLAFRLMGRDMEMCCDERVIRHMGRAETADYGSALVRLAVKRPLMPGSPLAFGESGTKGRLKNILNVRRPAFWVICVLVILLVLAGIALLANPLAKNQAELTVLDEFTAAMTRRHDDIVDRTAYYREKNPEFITEQVRVLEYEKEHNERIIAELAGDKSVEDLVNERLTVINNPLVDFFRPVHLYVKGNLVVQYVGADEALLKTLTELVGPEWPHMAPFLKLPAIVNISSTVHSVPLTNQDITDETDLRMIQSVIANCDSSKETWPDRPADEILNRVQLLVRQTPDSAIKQYTLYFDEAGSAYIVSDQTKLYCQLDDVSKTAIFELVRAGFYEDSAITVRSGEKEIKAIGHWNYSYNKITKVSADGLYLTAQNIKLYLNWLPIDFEKGVKDGSQSFAIFVNGQEQYGDFILYDDQMNRTDIIEMSGLAPQVYMLNSLAPGRYIVELRTTIKTITGDSGYQYFFGVIIE